MNWTGVTPLISKHPFEVDLGAVSESQVSFTAEKQADRKLYGEWVPACWKRKGNTATLEVVKRWWKVVVGGMAPCPYTLCCFWFENSEWSFFPCILHIFVASEASIKIQREEDMDSDKKATNDSPLTRKRFSGNPKLPWISLNHLIVFPPLNYVAYCSISCEHVHRNAGLTSLATPGSDEQRSKGCPYFPGLTWGCTQNPSGFSNGWFEEVGRSPNLETQQRDQCFSSSQVLQKPLGMHNQNVIA